MTDKRETRTYGEPMPLHSQQATYDGFRSVRLLNDDIGLATTTYSYKLGYDEVQEAAERIALMWNLHLGESIEELRHRYLDTPAPATNVERTEGDWQWWAGSTDEWCTVGPESSREAVIQAATNDSLGESDDDGSWKLVFHIVEARQDDLRLADWIESDRLLERAEDSVADSDRTSSEYDDGPWFECSAEQEKDLEERVKRACDEWQAAHGLKFSCPTFSHTRNKETIVVDLAIEALATTEGAADA